MTVSFNARNSNEEAFNSTTLTTSWGVKSDAITHSSTRFAALIDDERSERACRVPVPSGESPTTSIRSSTRSAMLLALFQLVLSWKASMYGLRKTQTPPIMVMTIASIMMTPRISLTASSSFAVIWRRISIPLVLRRSSVAFRH